MSTNQSAGNPKTFLIDEKGESYTNALSNATVIHTIDLISVDLGDPHIFHGVMGNCVQCWLIPKVRGPFVQTLCIEKDSYMDAI